MSVQKKSTPLTNNSKTVVANTNLLLAKVAHKMKALTLFCLNVGVELAGAGYFSTFS